MPRSRAAVSSALALLIFASLAVAGPAAVTKLHIEGMTCGGCAAAVKLVLKKTPGVVSSSVSYEEKRAEVTFDPSKTSPNAIAKEIATKLSYKVTVVQ